LAATWLAGPVTVRTVNERPVDTAPDTGEERTGAAAALRQLGHELVARDMTGEELARLRAAVEALTADVATAPVRQNAFANWVALLFDGDAPAHADHPPGEGLMTDSFVSGKTNPMGMAADVHLEGDEAVGRVTLGPAFEGAPGRAHGAWWPHCSTRPWGWPSRSRVRQPSPVASRSTTAPPPRWAFPLRHAPVSLARRAASSR